MELRFYMGFVTPPIHFSRVILPRMEQAPRSQSSKAFFRSSIDVYLGCTYDPCASPSGSIVSTIRSISHLSQDS